MQELQAQKLLKKYLAGNCTDMEKALLEIWCIRSEGTGLPEIPKDVQSQSTLSLDSSINFQMLMFEFLFSYSHL